MVDKRHRKKTDAEKEVLRQIAKKNWEERIAKKAEEEKAKLDNGIGDEAHKSGTDTGGGDNPSNSGDGGVGGGDSSAGGVHTGGTSSGTGRSIPDPRAQKQKPAVDEIVLDKGKILEGLPSFYILCFKAANNLLKLVNLFLPVVLEFDELTEKEAVLINNVVKPSVEKNLKVLGEEHPFLICSAVGSVVVAGKLKVRKKGKPGDILEAQFSEVKGNGNGREQQGSDNQE